MHTAIDMESDSETVCIGRIFPSPKIKKDSDLRYNKKIYPNKEQIMAFCLCFTDVSDTDNRSK